MYSFSKKLAAVKHCLKKWKKTEFGNISQNIKKAEDSVLQRELVQESDPYPDNREAPHSAQASLKRALQIEEEFWKQKSHMRWFKEGEGHTKLFHASVQQTRKQLAIHKVHKVKDSQGRWLTEEGELQSAILSNFTGLFFLHQDPTILEVLPSIVSADMNETLITPPHY